MPPGTSRSCATLRPDGARTASCPPSALQPKNASSRPRRLASPRTISTSARADRGTRHRVVHRFGGKIDDDRCGFARARHRRLRRGVDEDGVAVEHRRRQRGDPAGGFGGSPPLPVARGRLRLYTRLQLTLDERPRSIGDPAVLDDRRPRPSANLRTAGRAALDVWVEQQTQAGRAAQHLHSLGHLAPEFPCFLRPRTRRILRQKGRIDQRTRAPVTTSSPHDPGVADRVPAGLRPDAQPVRAATDRDRRDEVTVDG